MLDPLYLQQGKHSCMILYVDKDYKSDFYGIQ